MSQVAAVILTLNEQRHILDCVASVRWADRIVVVDTFSQDDTVTLARQAGAEVIERSFENYAQIRNLALAEIDAPWIFFVDADERATPELGAEIHQVIRERPEDGWWVPRHNYIFGKLTLGAGWYPDYQMRLLRRGKAIYRRPVHEIVELAGVEGFLRNPLQHLNYESVAQFHEKQRRYAQFDAGILYQQKVRPRFYTPVTQSVRQFIWRFWSLHGHRDGLHGLRLCLLMARYEFTKYRILARLWQD
jgi:(heptosyl)LPS beta-1,4-glucosyltransferase